MKRRIMSVEKWVTTRSIAVLCVIVLVCTLIPMLILAFYDHPCSDDYNYGLYAVQAVRSGGTFWDVLQAAGRKTAETYQNWQGTFSAIFLMALQPSIFGDQYYAITPFLMLGALLLSTFFFLKTVFVDRLGMSRADCGIVSCMVSFFSIHCLPSAFEGFYWFNGALFYTFFYSLSLFLYTFLLKFFYAPSRKAAVADWIAAFILAFLIGGGNYPTALLSILVLLCAAGWTFYKKVPVSKRIGALACLLSETASFYINISAPGNAVRQSYFPTHPNAIDAICKALVEAVRAVTDFTSIPFLLALLVLIPLLYRCAHRVNFRFPYPLLALIAAICILGVEMTPPLYAMDNTGAARMQDLYYYTYCLLAIAVIFYFCGWFSHRWTLSSQHGKNTDLPKRAVVFGALVCFCVSFLCQPELRDVSGVNAFLSLKNGEAQAYDQQVETRLTLYLNSELQDVVVSHYTVHPRLLQPSGVPDITADPENLTNQRVAAFYGKNSVRLTEK